MLLSDRDIAGYVDVCNLIDPFVSENVKMDGLLSYGLQPAGYDLRLGSRFKRPNLKGGLGRSAEDITDILYPWAIDPSTYQFYEMDEILLRPGDSVLAETFETVHMPLDLSASIQGKSSLARCFITLNTTVVDPGFNGKLTLEITNLGKMSVALRAGMGIGQIQFHKLLSTATIGYGEKGGIYQGQSQVEESKWKQQSP